MKLAGVLLLCCLAVLLVFAAETNLTLTVDDITYSNVTFRTVTPSSVKVFHSTGVVSIPLEKLPSDLQTQFGYDPLKAVQYRAAEASRRQQIDAQRRMQAAVDSMALVIQARIVQALPNGSLAEASLVDTTTNLVTETRETKQTFRGLNGKSVVVSKTDSGPTKEVITGRLIPIGTVFIHGLSNVYDGETWEGKVYVAGDYSYTTTQGAYKKVRAFSVTRPALR